MITRPPFSGFFHAGAAAPFSPADISGLKLWLAADSLALSDADPVATWADLSGEGNDATQATSGNRPIYKAAIVNGLPVVRFDGSNDLLRASFTLPQPISLYIVFKVLTPGAIDTVIDGVAGDSAIIRMTGGDTSKMEVYAGSFLTQTLTTPTAAFALFSVIFNGASSFAYSNGSLNASANAGSTAPNGFTLGAHHNAPGDLSRCANADIAELLAYSGAHGATDRQNIEDYLNAKYVLY